MIFGYLWDILLGLGCHLMTHQFAKGLRIFRAELPLASYTAVTSQGVKTLAWTKVFQTWTPTFTKSSPTDNKLKVAFDHLRI